MEFTGKVALVTGASSGIGAATAINFASLGASVVLVGRNLENLHKVAAKCGEKHLIVQADVTIDEDLQRMIDTTITKFGRLDILVNNAGIFEMTPFDEINVQQYERIFNTNVRAVFQLSILAAPHLIATQGNIVNVSSIAGLRPFPGVLSYCMAKAALDQFTKCISLDLAPKKVRVNSVNPAVIETDIFNRGGLSNELIEQFLKKSDVLHPLQRIGQPEEVADLIAFLASDKAGFMTGAIVPIDGGRQHTSPI